MLTKTFLFLDKIGKSGQQRLQEFTWDSFVKNQKIPGISSRRKLFYNSKIREAKDALFNDNLHYFVSRLPVREHWRLYEYFRDQTCFLDLEVDGCGNIIILTVSDGFDLKTFVRGVNLESQIVQPVIDKFKLVVTFNGSSFDIPKLKKFGLTIAFPHIDVRHLCNRLGLDGGLKNVEQILNLHRPPHLKGRPVDLWRAFHASRDKDWLQLLVEYNQYDVIHLKSILLYCFKRFTTLEY